MGAVDGGEWVILAEPDALLRRALCEDLEAAGYRVCGVADGQAALSLLRLASAPVVVVLGWELGALTGGEVVRAMTVEPGTAARHVYVFLTWHGTSYVADALRGYLANTIEVVTRPFELADLLDAVARAAREVSAPHLAAAV